jgi:hypothetical protein
MMTMAKSTPSSSMSQPTEVTSSSFPGIDLPETMTLDIPTPDAEHPFPRDGVLMELTVDAAGKVYAANIVNAGDQGPIGDALMSASSHWKFVPAMKDGKAIASHIWLTISPYK